MTPITRDELHAWPKAELHVHLDGSIRVATLLELAHDQGLTGLLPSDSAEGLEFELRRVDDSGSLEGYLDWFRYTLPLLQRPGALRRVAYEIAADAAAENVRYIEIRYSPVLHTEQGLTLEAVNDAVLEGLAEAERDFDIRCGVIVCALRGRHADASLPLARLAVDYRGRGVVGFDLAGPEAGHPAKHHLQAFYHARNHLVALTIHAGESWGPESIRQALFFCGAHRIGHGISLVRDPELLRYVADHQVALEICPTSNVQTRVVDGYAEHPVRALCEAGVAVTLNTDSRLFSRTTVTDEMWRSHELCGLSRSQLRQCAINGFRHAFLPLDEKEDLVRQVQTAIPTHA